MKCHTCNANKLRKEFPSETLSPDCTHPPLYCLRCAVKGAKENNTCPFKDCGQDIDEERLEECEAILSCLFPVIKSTVPDINDIELSGEQIYVATLDGERFLIPFSPDMYVYMLKEEVLKKTQIEINKQKLVYLDKDLEVYSEDGEFKKLGEYGVTKGATVHLMVLLYAIPDYMDNVIFDLSWGYPSTGRDFLDATCFAYSHLSLKGTVNYVENEWPSSAPSIKHSGDGMDDTNARGYHTIEVSLKNVPEHISHLFFMLSVWSNQSIANFSEPYPSFL